MNLGSVGQTFLSAGSGDFPVARNRNTGQECPVNPQAGKPDPPSCKIHALRSALNLIL